MDAGQQPTYRAGDRLWGGAFDRLTPGPAERALAPGLEPRIQSPITTEVDEVVGRLRRARQYYIDSYRTLAGTIMRDGDRGDAIRLLQAVTGEDVPKIKKIMLRRGNEQETAFKAAFGDAVKGDLLLQPEDGEIMWRAGTGERPQYVADAMRLPDGSTLKGPATAVAEAYALKADEWARGTGRPMHEFLSMSSMGVIDGPDGPKAGKAAMTGGFSAWMDRLRAASAKNEILTLAQTKYGIMADAELWGLTARSDDFRDNILSKTAIAIDHIGLVSRQIAGADADAMLAARLIDYAPRVVRAM